MSFWMILLYSHSQAKLIPRNLKGRGNFASHSLCTAPSYSRRGFINFMPPLFLNFVTARTIKEG